jgi:hypothetical protein
MTFAVGDKVKAYKFISDDYATGEPAVNVMPGTIGVVTKVWTHSFGNSKVLFEEYPYDVQFENVIGVVAVNADELEAVVEKPVRVSRFRKFLDRYFPANSAEEKFGTQETVDALHVVNTDGVPVNLKGQ